MKKLILGIVFIGMVVGGYFYVLKYVRAPLTILEGKRVKAVRGDLEVPITASGHIRPASVTQIKSEASGEVVEIPFDIGKTVNKGDLIIRLDETDERRNVERAEADHNAAEIALEQAELRKEEAGTVGIPMAEAKKSEAEARRDLAMIAFKAFERIDAMDAGTEQEYAEKDAARRQMEASVSAAGAELTQARVAERMAEKEVKAAGQRVVVAQRVLDEANQRLRETKVLSPIDGMIVAKHVQVGELVQSGRTSLTGGTVLIEIADVSDVYAEVNVDEADIGLVRSLAPPSTQPGGEAASQPATLPEGTIDTSQQVEITVEAYPDDRFHGLIERISPQSEIVRAIATFRVWIRITSDNRDKLERVLNTQAQANFTVKSVRKAILVDYEAMKQNPNGEGYGVYVPHVPPGKTKPEPKFVPCKFGVDNRVQVEVISGVDEGQDVYTELPKKTRKEEEAEQKASD